MSEFTHDDSVRLIALLEQELEAFNNILKLTEEQSELIAADEIEAFDKSLDSRQELMEIINRLHQESDVLMQSYTSFSEADTSRRIDGIDETGEQIREILAICAALNEKNTAEAKERSESYVDRINKLNLSRKSLGSYIQNVESNSELIDKRT